MIETDLLIIGAGPTGLFTVFEAGLLKDEMPFDRFPAATRGTIGRDLSQKTHLRYTGLSGSNGG